MRLGWLTDPDGTPYPPEPWHLGGDLLLSWLRPRATKLPQAAEKHFPRFTRTDTTVRIDDWAHLTYAVGPTRVPGLRRIALPTAQRWQGTDRISTNVVLARVKALQAAWLLDPDGPLGWLSEETPTLSLALTDASIAFGTKVKRTPA